MTVRVSLPPPPARDGDASYDILIAAGLLARLPALLEHAAPAPAYAVISDSHVATLYGDDVTARLAAAGKRAQLFAFAAGEERKNRDTWASLSDQMLAARFGRDCAVVAVGGGVVGDVAGFVAATYLRGVPWIQVPTSLLAMIDSSIGGKTGVDVAAGKNLVGAFHQPRLVIADLAVLATLPPAQLAAGLAEAVKHGAIADAKYFAFLEQQHAAILERNPQVLERLVRGSVEIKAAVVADDERERGRRAILNFGHTVGHAIETRAGYGVPHGAAVAMGMAAEARLAESLGIAAPGSLQRIADLLERLRLPVALPTDIGIDELIDAMRVDKKVRAGTLRFAVPAEIGTAAGDEATGWAVAVEEGRIRELFGRRPA